MRSQIISFVVIATSFRGTEGSPIHGYKFSRGVIFTDNEIEDHLLSTLELHMHCDCFKKN